MAKISGAVTKRRAWCGAGGVRAGGEAVEAAEKEKKAAAEVEA
jgi:hypothetical protein